MWYALSAVMILVTGTALCAGCSQTHNTDTDDTGQDSATTTDPGEDTGTNGAFVGLEARVLVTGLENPFEIARGPTPETLWVTERTAKRITEVSTTDGTVTVLHTIDEVLVTPSAQDGLLGMAIGDDAVFVAYTYSGTEGIRQTKIVRFSYDPQTLAFGNPQPLITGMPGSVDHNGGRLRIGPDGMIYYMR